MRLAHVESARPGRFALAIVRDVTARKAAEEAQHRLQLELEARNAELERVSRTDYLTGLWNRRHVDEQLTKAISAARRHGRPLAVVLLDVDNFKRINSEYGYQAGDAVLVEVSSRLAAEVRSEDTFGRWGGEEFLVVLPDTGLDVGLAAAERLRAVAAGAPVATEAGEIPVTISLGVAASTEPDRDALLRAADAALRKAKTGGKNRIAT